MEIHPSARRHGVSEADIRHAVAKAAVVVEPDPDADPPKLMVVGPNGAGNMLEVVVVTLAEGAELASHAMPLRRKYFKLLEGTSGG